MTARSSSSDRVLVYLANFTHDPFKTNVDDMPLAIGSIAAYLGAKFPDELEIRLFRFSPEFERALQDRRPDVVGFSNYCWNSRLNAAWVHNVKMDDPRVLTIMGGPNYPLDPGRQTEFLKDLEGLDIYIRNEAEPATKALMEHFLDCDLDIGRLKERELPNASWVDDGGQLVSYATLPRMTDLDEIPSPYLTGILDPFFTGDLMPSVQTTRGCPFRCTYCNEGVDYLSRVRWFSEERSAAELEYIAERVVRLCPEVGSIAVADNNFAMLPHYDAFIDKLVEIRSKYNYPRRILTNTGKNRHARIIDAIDRLQGALYVDASVQSMNPDTLTAIKRRNISIDAYMTVAEAAHGAGFTTRCDTILCLPEETRESYFRGLRQLIDASIDMIGLATLFMIYGSEAETDAARERYGLKTHWRASPCALTVVRGEPIVELEEIVTSTSTMDFEDALYCRKFQIWMAIFCDGGHFEFLTRFLREKKINLIDFLIEMRRSLDEAPEVLREVITSYEREARQELYPTREAVLQTYRDPEIVEQYIRGERGDALLNKYRVQPMMLYFDDLLRYVQPVLLRMLGDRLTPEIEQEVDSVVRGIRGRYVLSTSIREPVRAAQESLWHDVETWAREGFKTALSSHRLESRTAFAWNHPEVAWNHLLSEIEACGTSVQGLMKFRRRITHDRLRRRLLTDVDPHGASREPDQTAPDPGPDPAARHCS